MNRIKVGYLPFYIKLYDDNNQDRTPLVEYMHTLVKMIESQNIEVILADEICRVKSEFDRAVKKFNDLDVDAVITQHLAYSPSLESIDALTNLKAPIIILDTTPDYELIKTAGYKNCIDNDHGIHGVQDMCCMLKKRHIPFHICAGHAFHSDVVSRVVGLCRASACVKKYRNERIGSIGGSFTGMGDFLISDEDYKKQIGAEVVYMTPEIVNKYLSVISESEIDSEIKSDTIKYNSVITFLPEYKEATRSGLAIRKWMEEEKLDACTVNFLTLDTCGMPKMPFIECCKMMERRKGYAGEGDVLTAGLVGALISVYPDTTFAEMFCPDWEQNVILLSHMAESNPNLARWKPLLADMCFHYNSCGNTVGMYNCYRPGKVVYVNLAPMDEGYNMIVTEGEILDVGLERGAYGRNTQGWFKPCKPLAEFLEEYSMLGGTHHSAMVYQADIKEIKAFGNMMGFQVFEIS